MSMPKRLHCIGQVSIALCLCALLVACSASGTPTSKSTTPKGFLQQFSGWRAAYLGSDGRVHAVSFDGKSDAVGRSLPNLPSNGNQLVSAGISPTSSVLAYGMGELDIVDLAASPGDTRTEQALVWRLAWSADGSTLAIGDNTGGFWTVETASGHPIAVPGPSEPRNDGPWQLIGWIDADHLAVTDILDNTPTVAFPNGESYATAATVASLDITTGDVRQIATINSPGLGIPWYSMSPDGSSILFWNTDFRDYPYTPLVELIDTASGQVAPLTNIVSQVGASFDGAIWQPGTRIVAVSYDGGVQYGWRTWQLDVQHDSATHLLDGAFAVGWAPDGGPLIVSTGYETQVGKGPYTISAVTTTGQSASLAPLTHNAMTFPFLGFVKGS